MCNGKRYYQDTRKGYAEELLIRRYVYRIPMALVYQNEFSRRLPIDGGFTRLWRACPPQADLPASFVAGWPADHLMAASFTGGKNSRFNDDPIHMLL